MAEAKPTGKTEGRGSIEREFSFLLVKRALKLEICICYVEFRIMSEISRCLMYMTEIFVGNSPKSLAFSPKFSV